MPPAGKKRSEEPEEVDEAVEQQVVAQTAVEQTVAAESGEEFPVERLISDGAALVGYPSHVMAGALAGTEEENLTAEEAKGLAEEWLGTAVAAEPSEAE